MLLTLLLLKVNLVILLQIRTRKMHMSVVWIICQLILISVQGVFSNGIYTFSSDAFSIVNQIYELNNVW